MFQNEVAERIVASRGNKSYGRLSVLSNWRCNTSIKMKLNPEVFFPPPKVTSAVVQLEALAEPKYKSKLDVLEIVVATAFNQRRKMLRSSLKKITPDIETILKDIDIDPSLRAEDLTIEQFCLISNKLNLT